MMSETSIQQPPKPIYRIDKFQVPAAARAELLQNLQRTHKVIQAQPGFIQDFIFEQISGPGTFNFITMVVRESADALNAAKQRVTAHHAATGFNPHELFARLGIQADIANYTAIEAQHATQ